MMMDIDFVELVMQHFVVLNYGVHVVAKELLVNLEDILLKIKGDFRMYFDIKYPIPYNTCNMQLSVKGKKFEISQSAWEDVCSEITNLDYQNPNELPEMAIILGFKILKMQYSKNTLDNWK